MLLQGLPWLLVAVHLQASSVTAVCLSCPQDVPLFIVDEMHLLGGPHGPALEVRRQGSRQLG